MHRLTVPGRCFKFCFTMAEHSGLATLQEQYHEGDGM